MRPRNFHYIKNKLIHFDFDDISNNWYIYDIAVAVFHETELYKSKEDRTNFMLNFLKYFIEGYKSEKIISQECIILLLEFIKIRLIYAYIDYYKRLKIKSIDS
jgi:Ser/Thr protein kinase RdoA (MazF antagonist)